MCIYTEKAREICSYLWIVFPFVNDIIKETKKLKAVFKFPKKGEIRNMQSQLEEKILLAAIEEFGRKGLKFTMDDIAKNLSISKKTLYHVYDNKEAMLLALADYCFADIKKSERAIVENPDLDVVDKIEQILVVLPERYQNIGLSNLYQLSEKYPNIYTRVSAYLSTDWDATNALIEQGVAEGKIRPIALPVLQAMVESTIQKFFADSILVEHGISYEDALHEMIQIIIHGIRVEK